MDLQVLCWAQSPSMIRPSTPHLASPKHRARMIAEMLRRSYESTPGFVDT
jgi:hypothetical protein